MFSPVYMDRDSPVGIATCYGLNSPWIKLPMGTRLSASIQISLGSTQPPVKRVLCFFPGGKLAGAWRWPPTLSSAEKRKLGCLD